VNRYTFLAIAFSFSTLFACDQKDLTPSEIFSADPKDPPIPPVKPRKAGDGPSMAVVSDGSELGKMFGSCGFEGGDPLYTSYEEWLGEGPMRYIILETRVYTTEKNDACVRAWFESAGAYPIGVGSSESGSESTNSSESGTTG